MTRLTCHHNKTMRSKTASAGFTMVELLAVVGILAIVGLIAVFSLGRLRLDLRQRELDSKAELLYTAAQKQMAELHAAGWEDWYQPGIDGVVTMPFPPSDADEESQKTSFCYVLANTAAEKETTAAAAILPMSAVDAELWDGCWYIEYAPDSGSVYAVFYSVSPLPDPNTLDDYRSYQYRRRMGAKVGYYGGDIAQTQQTGTLQPSLTIENAEKLTATFYCNRPTEQPITLTIQLSDGISTYTKKLAQSQLYQQGSRLYRYIWVLDDLTRDSTRFYAQTGGKLLCGVPITVTLTASSDDPLVDQVSVSAVTNGLFDDRTDYGTDSATALISCGRHLQNLDAASHAASTITSAVQISDISFTDDTTDDKDWYSCYGPSFTPITNQNLTRYSGLSQLEGSTAVQSSIYGLTVSSASTADVGLFSSFAGSIDHVTLTGVKATAAAGAAGALIGRASGAVTISDCAVYLNARRGDLAGMTAEDAAGVPARIAGGQAGGLVGVSGQELTIRGSFAATTVSGSANAGGLVGYAGAHVSVTGSYADCYLTAPVTGGLVGGAAQGAYTTLTNCYAVGYQTAGTRAAGLVNGTLDRAEATYSACAFYGDAQDIYTTAVGLAGSAATAIDHVFYLRGDLSDNYTALEGTDGRTYDQLCSDAFRADINRLYGVFTAPSGSDSHPYNLLNQGLSTYSYPRLTALEHYGDWQAQFESDALVYYEVYSDGTYGFFGGNVDSLSEAKTIVGDGYAVALSQQPAAGWSLTVSCGTSSITLTSASTRHTAYYNGEAYYLFPVTFPAAVTAPSGTHAAFRQEVTVGSRTYYFNPYFAKSVTTGTGTPDTIYLRTARHLYALSLYYTNYAAGTGSSTYLQERDIDYATYDWSGYTAYTSVRQQAPIDSANGFAAQYDGDGHTITGVSFVSDSRGSIGMFATVARSGQVRNTVLMASGSEAVRVYGQLNGSTVRTYAGVLAGRNYGIIANCAASGYGFVGFSGSRDYGLVAYNYSTLYIGGLVGGNFASGSSRNGSLGIFSSEANCPSVIVSAYNASVYAGGLAGVNNGAIQSSYALGSLFAKDVRSSTVWLSGFAGSNNGGSLRYCYSATALTAAGEAEVYGLTRIGGGALECCYLNGGTYSYGGHLYAYNTAANSFSSSAAGRPITGADLEKLRLSGFSRAAVTRYDGTDSYPYPAVVRNDANRVVHYGQWPTLEHIGTLGVFYWEYESGGSAGYHLSYVGTDDGTPITGSSLCTQHNDGGVVTRYGYGYFCATNTVTSADDISYQFTNCRTGTRRSEVEQALAAQMKGYSFVAFETGPVSRTAGDGSVSWTREDTMYLTGADVNSQWTLSYGGGSIQAEEMRNNYNGTGRSTNIWVAGLVGGVILRDQGNLESSMGTTSNPLTVQNCYSYVKLPTTTNAKTHVVASFAIASNGEMLHSFSIRYNSNGIQYTIPNPHAIIRNCYCLTSAVVNTNDYTSFRNLSDADWKAGKNINMKDTSDVRRVVLTNDRSPYISYQDMADPDKLAAWLNNGVSASPLTFDFVTVEENGVRIDGKYSFPGADAGRLDGLNYPFPTILTQLDAFGRMVNVHYGPWPMHGLYWESTSADLDLFADRGDGRLPTLTVGLYPENNAVNTGQTPAITLLNEDGTPADDTLIGSTAVAAYDTASGCWQVTFTASAAGGEGVVVARASLGSYTADLTIRVGAVLSLTHDKPAGVTVRYGAPSETVTLSLRDSHGDPVTADAAKGETIGWSAAAETLADGTAVVECDAADIRAVAGQAGDFTLPVTGFAAGDSAITVTCTYTYLENGVPKRIQSSTIISARSLRDAVGLVYDVEEDTVLRTTVNGVYLPCEGTGSTEGGDVTAPGFERQTGSLYLFAGNAYTDLNDFTVDLSGLTAVDSGGNALDGTRWAIYAGDVIEADDYRYRLLTVETDQPQRLYISGTVTLRRNGVTYRLTLTNYPCGADPAP